MLILNYLAVLLLLVKGEGFNCVCYDVDCVQSCIFHYRTQRTPGKNKRGHIPEKISRCRSDDGCKTRRFVLISGRSTDLRGPTCVFTWTKDRHVESSSQVHSPF